MNLPVSAIELVPHRNRMLLIDNLDGFGEGFGSGVLKVKRNGLFVTRDNQLDTIVFVELLAQLVAAHSGYESKLGNGNPKVGFLVGIKDFNFVKNILVDDVIEMRIRKEHEFDQINYVNGKIIFKDEIIAEGTLKVWEKTTGKENLESTVKDPTPEKHIIKLSARAKNIIQEMDLNQDITDNIYELNITGDFTTADAKLYFPDQFIGFDGHFPGYPLLPGVLMMKTGLLLAELVLGKKVQLTRIQQAKFAKSIFPNQIVRFSLKLNYLDEDIKINVVISRNEEICSKFSFITLLSENI